MLVKTLWNSRNLLLSRAVSLHRVSLSVMPVIEEKFVLPSRLVGSERNVWMEYDKLATEYKPLKLGGSPDYIACQHIVDTLANVSKGDPVVHQYTRGFGHPRLIGILSQLYSKLIGRDINGQKEILVTYGAYEALYCAILGHVDQGDEVILIEPFYDCYEPMVRAAGGTPCYIPFRQKAGPKSGTSADWVLDFKELEGKFNEKTKLIIINNPNNPLGKVFTAEELQAIADLCKKWNVVCISDEVYEWMVYKPNKHTRIAKLPGMWERTITIGSAGKVFGVTGWKTGWAYGPEHLMFNLQIVHQNCLYTIGTIIQEAVAMAFEKEMPLLGKDDCIFNSMSMELEAKRDYIVEVLRDAGMKPIIPEGGYFVVSDWSPLESQVDLSAENDKNKDYQFTKWMIKNLQLQGIPPSAFYSEGNQSLGENYVRFCFMKKDETLKKVASIFQNWKSGAQ